MKLSALQVCPITIRRFSQFRLRVFSTHLLPNQLRVYAASIRTCRLSSISNNRVRLPIWMLLLFQGNLCNPAWSFSCPSVRDGNSGVLLVFLLHFSRQLPMDPPMMAECLYRHLAGDPFSIKEVPIVILHHLISFGRSVEYHVRSINVFVYLSLQRKPNVEVAFELNEFELSRMCQILKIDITCPHDENRFW